MTTDAGTGVLLLQAKECEERWPREPGREGRSQPCWNLMHPPGHQNSEPSPLSSEPRTGREWIPPRLVQ